MKKTVLTLSLVALGAGYAFAQGSLTWGNQFGTTFYAPVYGVSPTAPTVQVQGQSAVGRPAGTTVYDGGTLQGTGFTLGFFWAPAGTTDPNAFQLLDTMNFRTASTATALPGGLGSVVGGKGVTITGHDAGTSIAYQLRAWDNKGGTVNDWAGALLGAHGMSTIGTIQALAGTSADGTLFLPTQTTGITSFNLVGIVPEPTSFALLGLGAAAMLIFRRRN